MIPVHSQFAIKILKQLTAGYTIKQIMGFDRRSNKAPLTQTARLSERKGLTPGLTSPFFNRIVVLEQVLWHVVEDFTLHKLQGTMYC